MNAFKQVDMSRNFYFRLFHAPFLYSSRSDKGHQLHL